MEWVLSRPLYRFSRFDLKHVARAQRSQVLRILIRQWSPFANTGQYVVWGQEYAFVWAWDADRLAVDLAEQKLAPASTRVIPETLLHPPLQSGSRLVTCLDGVEGQIWQNQRPVHSHWWAQPPAAVDWRNFLRDAGLAASQDDAIPVALAVARLKQPWSRSTELSNGEGLSRPFEAWFVRGLLLLLMAFTFWLGIDLIKTRQASAQLKTQLDDAGQGAQPLLEARRKALEALARIEKLQAFNPYPAQLVMLAEVSNILPKNGAYLSEWDYQNGKLKITVVSPEKLSSSFLVKKLLDTGWFRNVQSGPSIDVNTLTFTMETIPQNNITLLNGGASGQGGPNNKAPADVEPPKSSQKS